MKVTPEMSLTPGMKLTTAQLDRACGVMIGTAVGDALGAPYEFGLATPGPDGPQMIGGGLGDFAPGEWTDDTTMAWCILDVAASGADLRTEPALTEIAQRFRDWYDTRPPDIGNQTRSVLAAAGARPTGTFMTEAAANLHARTGRTAGNGSLMRTAPVALAHLDDPVALADAARRVSALTHHDQQAQDACVLWSLAIRHAVLEGEFDVRVGLPQLDPAAAEFWVEHLDEAERSEPGRFQPNGWVVTALQAAWSAIAHTPVPTTGDACRHLSDALTTAIAIGHDTDTVAAIAGGLLGARWGASAVPATWRRICHGYPGLAGERLVELAHLAANGRPLGNGWPRAERIDYPYWVGSQAVLVRHPVDAGVWLGDVRALENLPDDVTAVVSLCLIGNDQLPEAVEHVSFRLIDQPEPPKNLNLDFVLADAARTVATLRAEDHQVLVHCVAAQSRTPAVGIAYAMVQGVDHDTAVDQVLSALESADPNRAFRAALRRLDQSAHVRSWQP